MVTRISLLIIFFCALFACEQHVSSVDSEVKEGMIKMSIFYPNGDNKTFDMDYYTNKHMPMAAEILGDSLVSMSIEKGIANGSPILPVKYLAIGSFYFESMSSFQTTMGPNSSKLRADVENFTNIIPEIQINEVQLAE